MTAMLTTFVQQVEALAAAAAARQQDLLLFAENGTGPYCSGRVADQQVELTFRNAQQQLCCVRIDAEAIDGAVLDGEGFAVIAASGAPLQGCIEVRLQPATLA